MFRGLVRLALLICLTFALSGAVPGTVPELQATPQQSDAPAGESGENPEAQDAEEQRGWGARLKGMFKRGSNEEAEQGGEGSSSAEWDANSEVLLTNLQDPGQPFEIVDSFPVIEYREWGGTSRPLGGLKDPLVVSLERALTAVAERAEESGGNAVLGLTVEFENHTEIDEGRVVVYGTIVRLLEDEAQTEEVGVDVPADDSR